MSGGNVGGNLKIVINKKSIITYIYIFNSRRPIFCPIHPSYMMIILNKNGLELSPGLCFTFLTVNQSPQPMSKDDQAYPTVAPTLFLQSDSINNHLSFVLYQSVASMLLVS